MDFHKNLFGTDKSTPFTKGKAEDWKTTAKNSANGDVHASQNAQSAGNSTFQKPGDYKMQFMTSSQRTTGVKYSGIQHTDDELVIMFREKLASRGARGILGMQRIFKIMDDNHNQTLEI